MAAADDVELLKDEPQAPRMPNRTGAGARRLYRSSPQTAPSTITRRRCVRQVGVAKGGVSKTSAIQAFDPGQIEHLARTGGELNDTLETLAPASGGELDAAQYRAGRNENKQRDAASAAASAAVAARAARSPRTRRWSRG